MDKHDLTIKMGQWLRHNRVSNKLHQRDISDLLGLTPASISLMESGHHAISIFNYLILNKFFVRQYNYERFEFDLQGLPID